MAEQIARIDIPDFSPSALFPLTELDYGFSVVQQPMVVSHTFEAANRKLTQRFLIGTGARRFNISQSRLTLSERTDLLTFWETLNGVERPFWFDAPNEDGTVTRITARFEAPDLTFESLTSCLVRSGVVLVEVPATVPNYAVASTQNRFPSAALNTALLEQVQQIVPLLKIIPTDPTCPAIYLSDRKATVGGQLYQPRLLDWSGISQGVGEEGADQASFTLGNADRVFTQVVNDVDLFKARVEFSLYHIATGVKLDLWAGDATDWSLDEGPEFRLSASDGLYELSLGYPCRKIDRSCWKEPGTPACPNYNGACNKSWEDCVLHGQTAFFGGVLANPQTVVTKDNSTGRWGMGRDSITSRSLLSDSLYGEILPEIYTEPSVKRTVRKEWVDTDEDGVPDTEQEVIETVTSDFPVNCKIASGREEGDFYTALGVIGQGPLGQLGDGHKLDGSLHHGPDQMGLRTSVGPDPTTDFFGLDATGQPFGPERAAGTAFVQIRKVDEKGLQLSKLTEHAMQAFVRYGLEGFVWTEPGVRVTQCLTNPVWIAINMLIRARGKWHASVADQEALFDVPAAIAAGAFCDQQVAKIVGEGNEKQFTFRGVLAEEKPLRDWMREVLNTCLGYFVFNAGKLKIGLRSNSGSVSAFTQGNVVADSIRLAPLKPQFNHLTVGFGDEEWDFKANTVTIPALDYAKRIGGATSPLFLKSNLNLVGCSDKSHAVRFAMCRIKEELGGAVEAEWDAARQIGFKTTVLALETEPGMVISLDHPILPAGHGEFRILRWTLNRDFSIDVEGRTTTDSMYDMLVGPQVVDVIADPIPVEAAVPIIPGDVQPIGEEPFLLVKTEDGLNASLDIAYNPPADFGVFAGVTAHWVPDGDVKAALAIDFDYNGNQHALDAARHGTLRFVIPQPIPADAPGMVYLTSRTASYKKPLVLAGFFGESPHVAVTISQTTNPGAILADQPTDQGWSASIARYASTTGGQPQANPEIVVTERPANCNYFTAWYYPGANPPADPSLWIQGPNVGISAEGSTIVGWWMNRESVDVTYQLCLTASYGRTQFPGEYSPIPVKTLVIPKPGPATQVTNFAVTVQQADRGGVPSGRFAWSFTPPADLEFFYASVERIACDNTFTPLPAAEWGRVGIPNVSSTQADYWSLPTAAEYWRFRARSWTRAEIANDVDIPTCNVTVPASSGVGVILAEQPAANDWSVSVARYGADQFTNRPMANIEAVVTARPENTKYFTAWFFKGSNPPTDISQWQQGPNVALADSGSTTVGFWVPREDADVTYQVAITASYGRTQFPDETDPTPVKSVLVEKPGAVAQPTNFNVSVIPEERGGVPSGRFQWTFTAPVDNDYFHVSVERIWCDETFTPVPGAEWGEVGVPVASSSQADPWSLPTNTEFWLFRGSSVSRSGVKNTTNPPTVQVIVPGSSGLNLDTLAPGPITPAGHDIIEYFRDGDRKMVRVGLKAQLPPSSSNYEGVHVYAEVPDGSDPANPRTKAGAFVAGVHRANKDFAPVDLSRHPHQASSHYVAVVVVDEPSSNVSARFYGASYGKVENQLVPADQPNATPSWVVQLTPEGSGSAISTGAEFCRNITGFSIPADGAHLKYVFLGGIKYVELRPLFTPPTDPKWTGIQVLVYRKSDMTLLNAGNTTKSDAVWESNRIPSPSPAETWVVRALSFSDPALTPTWDDDRVNTYIPGVTPEVEITVGDANGSIDLAKVITESVGRALAVVDGVLGVNPGGITEDLIGQFAITQQKLANMQIIDAARLVDNAVGQMKLENAQIIDAARICDLAVTTAKIQNLAITNAKIANLAVDGAKIANAAIDTAKIANAAITTALIQEGAITTALIKNAAITNAKIGDAEITDAKIANGTISSAKIGSLAVDKITSWEGATINVGNGMTISGNTAGYAITTSAGIQAKVFKASTGPYYVGTYTGQTATMRVPNGSGGNDVYEFRGGILVSVS
jgi:hypothetical protein